jgi:hypothetical protein
MGTRTLLNPDANPIMNRATMTPNMSHASVWTRPPIKKVQVFIMRAPRRPRASAIRPAIMAPKGPPTANALTAKLQLKVECPGNTTLAGAFMTPVL